MYICTEIDRVEEVDSTDLIFFQIQTLQQEKERLNKDLEEVYKRHKKELEIQQLQHFQVNKLIC